MTKNYKSFVEAAKWYSSPEELDAEERRNSFSGYHDYDEGGDGGDYYDDDGDPDEYGKIQEFQIQSGREPDEDMEERELDLDMDFDRDEDPKTPINVGEEVVYLGNTGGRRYQLGSVHKLREDGKIVVRFDDKKLVAVSKPHLRHKLSEEEIVKKKAELEIKKQERKTKRAEQEAKRLAQEEEAKKNPPPVTGARWWEKNKKE